MLKLRNEKHRQKTVWEELLPKATFELDEELKEVDGILDNDVFLTPFLQKHGTYLGRPTIPVEVYLRLMYLKYRHELSYTKLLEGMNKNPNWRTFCRLSPDDRLPDATTLFKTTRRYGEDHVLDLFRLLSQRTPLAKIDFSSIEGKRPREEGGFLAGAISRTLKKWFSRLLKKDNRGP